MCLAVQRAEAQAVAPEAIQSADAQAVAPGAIQSADAQAVAPGAIQRAPTLSDSELTSQRALQESLESANRARRAAAAPPAKRRRTEPGTVVRTDIRKRNRPQQIPNCSHSEHSRDNNEFPLN